MPFLVLLIFVPIMMLFTLGTLSLLLNEMSPVLLAFITFVLIWGFCVRVYNEHRRQVQQRQYNEWREEQRLRRHEGFAFYLSHLRK